MSDACTWPEQDAVDAWIEKHGIKVEFKQAMELKEAVTAYRIKVQSELDSMRAQQTEAPVNVPSDWMALHNELGKMRWLGADEGWDAAIEAVRKRLVELAAAPAPVQTQQVSDESFLGRIAKQQNVMEHTIKDAERYRWLATRYSGWDAEWMRDDANGDPGKEVIVFKVDRSFELPMGRDITPGIDAAIAKEKAKS